MILDINKVKELKLVPEGCSSDFRCGNYESCADCVEKNLHEFAEKVVRTGAFSFIDGDRDIIKDWSGDRWKEENIYELALEYVSEDFQTFFNKLEKEVTE